jgi:pimeloyl-ACP methyl ester carboxylesterase
MPLAWTAFLSWDIPSAGALRWCWLPNIRHVCIKWCWPTAQQVRSFWAGIVRGSLDTLGLNTLRTRLQESYNRRFASQDYLTAGPLRDTFLQVIQEDLTLFAQRVQAPTLLIWGDQDADTPLWQGQRLEQLIPDAGLIVFKGAGHFSYLERLNDYIRIVDHFLTEGS